MACARRAFRYFGTAVGARVGAPVRHQDDARLDQLQAVEVAANCSTLRSGTGTAPGCLVDPQRLLERLAGVDAVVDAR